MLARAPVQVWPATADQSLHRRGRRLALHQEQRKHEGEGFRRLGGHRLRGQPPHVAIAARQAVSEGFGEGLLPALCRSPPHRLLEGFTTDLEIGVAHAGDQRLGRLGDLPLQPRKAADRLQPKDRIAVSQRAKDNGVIRDEGRGPRRRRPVASGLGIAQRAEDVHRGLPRLSPGDARDGRGRPHPAVLVFRGGLELLHRDSIWRRHLQGQPLHHGIPRFQQLGQHRGKRLGRGLRERCRGELPGLGVGAADEALELADLVRRGPADCLLKVGQAEGVRPQSSVDRVHVQAPDAPGGSDEQHAGRDPDQSERLDG